MLVKSTGLRGSLRFKHINLPSSSNCSRSLKLKLQNFDRSMLVRQHLQKNDIELEGSASTAERALVDTKLVNNSKKCNLLVSDMFSLSH